MANVRLVDRRRFLTGAAATAAALPSASSCSNGSEGGSRPHGPLASQAGSGTTSTTTAQRPSWPGTRSPSGWHRGIRSRTGSSSGPASPRTPWPPTASEPCPTFRSTWSGRWPPTSASPGWSPAGCSPAEAGPRPQPSTSTPPVSIPGTDYHYRFRVGEWTSPIGRTRTLADGSPDRFALAIANCQWYETGTYAAYRHMAAEDIDLVVHLGDYIYEYGRGPGCRHRGVGHRRPAILLESLADYRVRYASYKTRPGPARRARPPPVLLPPGTTTRWPTTT